MNEPDLLFHTHIDWRACWSRSETHDVLGCRWSLRISRSTDDTVSVHIYCNGPDRPSQVVVVQIKFDNEKNWRTCSHFFTANDNVRGWEKLHIKPVRNELHCWTKVWITHSPVLYRPISELSCMELKREEPDLTIKVGGSVLTVHSSILAASSEYFEALFRCSMKESTNKEIVLHDMTEQTVKHVLHYFYSPVYVLPPSISFNELLDLAKAADMFQMCDLKQHTELRLMQSINEETVLCLFFFSKAIHMSDLEYGTRSYVKSNVFKFRNQLPKLSEMIVNASADVGRGKEVEEFLAFFLDVLAKDKCESVLSLIRSSIVR